MLRISEIFKSIQGEGRYQGTPVIFIRVSGCTRSCSFCDSKYHILGKEYSIEQIVKEIKKLKLTTIVFTGGEPLIYFNEIKKIVSELPYCSFHLESNGDLIKNEDIFADIGDYFDYICISPKDNLTAKRINGISYLSYVEEWDIKVVTDLNRIGTDRLEHATMLMPLTTYDVNKDKKIRQKVWDYCVTNNLFYSGRMHIEIWGKKRKI